MRAYTLISTLALSLAAAACATPSDDGPIVGDQGGNLTKEEAFFEQNVQPILVEHCASCHSNTNEFNAPRFLGETPEQYYDKLVANTMFVSCDVENSILLLKGADPNHAGVSLPGSGKPRVEEWLGLEAIARFDGICSTSPPPPDDPDEPPPQPGEPEPTPDAPLTGQTAMKQFGDCMTLTDWVATGMDQVANQNSNYNGQNDVKCYSCHDTKLNTVTQKWVATGGNHMPNPNAGNADEQVMHAFEAMRYMYDSFNLVRWTVNSADGSFTDLVMSQRWRDKGVEGGSHPSYTLEQEYQDAYAAFFQLTYDRWKSGVCSDGPPAPDAPPSP